MAEGMTETGRRAERLANLEEAERNWINTSARMLAARERIVEATDGKRGVSGSVACPHCDKRVHYAVAHNGHVRARCETAGCVAWIE